MRRGGREGDGHRETHTMSRHTNPNEAGLPHECRQRGRRKDREQPGEEKIEGMRKDKRVVNSKMNMYTSALTEGLFFKPMTSP